MTLAECKIAELSRSCCTAASTCCGTDMRRVEQQFRDSLAATRGLAIATPLPNYTSRRH